MNGFQRRWLLSLLAASLVTLASASVAQEQDQALLVLLPPALEGWTRDTESDGVVGYLQYRGPVAATASYTDGSSSFTITFEADAESIANTKGIISNPDMTEYMGGKIVDIAGTEFLTVSNMYLAVIDDVVAIEATPEVEIVAEHLAQIDFEALADVGN